MHEVIEFLWVLKNVCLAIAALAIVFYAVWYSLLSNWKKYTAGRRVLQFVGSLVAVMGYVLLALFDGDTFFRYPITEPSLERVILGVLVYGIVAYSSIRLDITMVRIWYKGEVPPNDPFVPREDTVSRTRRAEKRNR